MKKTEVLEYSVYSFRIKLNCLRPKGTQSILIAALAWESNKMNSQVLHCTPTKVLKYNMAVPMHECKCLTNIYLKPRTKANPSIFDRNEITIRRLRGERELWLFE